MEYLGCGELNQILDRVNGWIENCDFKVSVILSGMGIFAGIFLVSDYISKFTSIFRAVLNNIGILSIAYLFISFLSLGLLIYGAILLVSVLFARINPTEFQNRAVKSDSVLFFSSIAKNKSFLKYKAKVRKCSKEQLMEDLVSQIYICALICDKKFRLYKKGLLYSIIGFCTFMFMMIVGVAVF